MPLLLGDTSSGQPPNRLADDFGYLEGDDVADELETSGGLRHAGYQERLHLRGHRHDVHTALADVADRIDSLALEFDLVVEIGERNELLLITLGEGPADSARQ
jgi:hypothetical protein